MLNLATFLDQHTKAAGLGGPDGQTVPLPVEVYEVLIQVAGAMLAGNATGGQTTPEPGRAAARPINLASSWHAQIPRPGGGSPRQGTLCP